MAKNYNHRSAERRFKKEQEKEIEFMRKCGMTESKIKMVQHHNRKDFNSDRRYYERKSPKSEFIIAFAIQPEDNPIPSATTLEEFLERIPIYPLSQALEMVSTQVKLMTFLKNMGYSDIEVARIIGVHPSTVCRNLDKLYEFYQYFKKNQLDE